jgi:hypothetical protein
MNDHGFEDLVETQCYQAGMAGRLIARRQGTKCRAVSDVRSGRVMYIPEASMPDFVGCTPAGRLVLFDAKSSGHVNTWRLKRGQVHQQDIMARYAQFGALCFFLVEARRHNAVYALRVVHGTAPEGRSTGVTWANWSEATNAPGARVLVAPMDILGQADWIGTILAYWSS